ncbi:MAG: metal ABC transporter substrate-binding protein [Moraxella sp.]|nr:metal ABC transporter substrate-binding protein [Moraxella sp.]
MIKTWQMVLKVVLFVLFGSTLARAGTVSVSNYPLLLLSNEVTQGNADAQVLLEAGDVGHHGSLSPSGVKLVKDSQFVVWFGQELEQNLVNTLQHAPNVITLYKFRAFTRLPLRDVDGTPKADTLDPHIWLDPDNAKAIVRALAVIHGHANPEHKALYLKNAQTFAERMDKAVAEFAQAQPLPYWAYHDAYQYMERSAKLSFFGALTPDHHLSPKASQIKALNKSRPSAHMCLVSQGKVSDGIKNKLGNVSDLLLQEDMSDAKITDAKTDFVATWVDSVQKIRQCVNKK